MANQKPFPHRLSLKNEIETGLTIWTDTASRNLIAVCVDGRLETDIYGRFYTLYAEDAIPFEGVCSLLLQMDRVYDTIDFPQSQTKHRKFNKDLSNRFTTVQNERNGHLKASNRKGRQSTFIVKVDFRANSTWQGTVTWVEGNEKVCFRSALELIRLIDSAAGDVKDLSGCTDLWCGEPAIISPVENISS